MPSPLPGMDPYLESPNWFPCLRDGLIFGILESLQMQLPETYYAQSTQRVWLEVSHFSVEPDGNVVHSGRRSSRGQTENGDIAVADPVELAEPVVVSVEAIEDARSRNRSSKSVDDTSRKSGWSPLSRC